MKPTSRIQDPYHNPFHNRFNVPSTLEIRRDASIHTHGVAERTSIDGREKIGSAFTRLDQRARRRLCDIVACHRFRDLVV